MSDTLRPSERLHAIQHAIQEISGYEVVELLGQVFSGPVFRARDPELERWVALRLIPCGLVGQGQARFGFLRDARAAAALEHPNVCPVYEVGETSDQGFYLVCALCEGDTLEVKLRKGTARPGVAVELATQIAAGVAQAHERGLLHGRLRPTNVKVGTDGQARVLDLGLASLEEQTWDSRVLRQDSDWLQGFLAPELLRGAAASPRSDVWAIGALLSAMLTGKPPSRQDPGVVDLAGAATLPEDLLSVLARALAPQPEDRQAHAGELRDELRRLRRTDSKPALRSPSPALVPAGGSLAAKYDLGEMLGSGGMGVVYKARDVQLGRTVALKFLPPELARDPAAKARFFREARAASALDHPNVCTIYEFGETEEHQLYLAMACYDGETLRSKLSRGPLEVSEALDCALQAARGLAKAHRHGIVHRDVKPANLMVTGDGLVKILDFGIAKLAGEAAVTRIGSAVGTPSYMSPEQIRAAPVDGRTDLWSLGVVLYEMLAGRPPFPGGNPEAVRAMILAGEPEPLSRLRPDTPAALEQIVHRLLQQEPENRYPTADALLADLRTLQDPPASRPSLQTVALPPPRRAVRLPRLALGAAAVIAATAAIAASWLAVPWLRREPAGADPPRGAPVTQLTDREGQEQFPSLSPDGNYFAYTRIDGHDEDVFLQRVGGGNPINLTADWEGKDTHPAFSPDGAWIAFRSDRDGGGIFLMGATGESVRRLTDDGYHPAWSPDGKEIAFATEPVDDPTVRRTKSEIWRVEVASGRRRRVAMGGALQPSWSPHGRRIAYWGGFGDGSARKALWTVPIDGGRPTPLLEDSSYNWGPAWAPDGSRLYFLSDRSGSMNLWRLPLDEASGTARGAPEPVTIPAHFVRHFSLSRDGRRLLYATEEESGSIDQVELTADGRSAGALRQILRITKRILSAAPSPDGQWIVLYAQSPQEDLFLVRPDGSDLRQLTDDPYHDRAPRWSPDGRWIYFYTDRNGLYEIWAIRPDGSGAHLAVSGKSDEVFNPVPSPDGRWLAVRGFSGAALVDLSRPLAQRVPVPFTARGTGGKVFVPRGWSPDMRWMVGTVHARGTLLREGMGLYAPATGSFERLPEDGVWPAFLGGSETVLYLTESQGEVRAWNRGSRRPWTVVSPQEGYFFRYFSLSSDHRRLYTVRGTSEGDIWLLGAQDDPAPGAPGAPTHTSLQGGEP